MVLMSLFVVFNEVLATATVTTATGGSAISSDTVEGAYTSLTGPIVSEGATADIGTGTIILNVPSGFIFDVASSVTATVAKISGNCTGSNPLLINGGTSQVVTPTTTTITISITRSTAGNCVDEITWTGIKVRPTSSLPLAGGNITKTGTSVIVGVVNSVTNFGTLTEVAPVRQQSRSPATITVVVKVVNDNGGTKTINDFQLSVNNVRVASGETNTFIAPGPAYYVTITNNPDYVVKFSGDCDYQGGISLVPGDNKLCTITNDDKEIVSSNIDYNKDRKIDISDWSIFLNNWSSSDEAIRKQDDLNKDGGLDIFDFSIFLASFQLGSSI